jgi:NAD(P)-dependent dehydrogenase (short-subunit alcohol dehydrogenase family)
MKDQEIKQLFEEMIEANATATALLVASFAKQMETGQLMASIANVKSVQSATKKTHPKSRHPIAAHSTILLRLLNSYCLQKKSHPQGSHGWEQGALI